MFDVDLAGGESYRESNNFRPGELAVVAELPWGRLGLTVCYDLRFPALYRALAEAGATFLSIPAAFTKQTGEAHWHVLMRARAIENGCFVFAAAQGGAHENGRATFGHSLVVDPWGQIARRGRRRARQSFLPKSIWPRSRQRGPVFPRCCMAGVSKSSSPWPNRSICAPCGARHDPLHAQCDNGHSFESWFADSAAYDKQAKRSLIACPICNSTKVDKAIMAPRLGRSDPAAAIETPARHSRHACRRPPASVAMVSPGEHELRRSSKNCASISSTTPTMWDALSRTGAQNSLRRNRASLDLRRSDGRRGQGTARGRRRLPSAAGPAGRVQLKARFGFSLLGASAVGACENSSLARRSKLSGDLRRLDCFVAPLLAMTTVRVAIRRY